MANDKIRKNYKDIADAIRGKTGENGLISAEEMPQKISEIKTGIEPTGTKEIRANGEFNIRDYEKVDVNVQSTGNNPLQDMLDRSSNTNGSYLFHAINDHTNYNIFSRLTYENLITLDFSNKHYTDTSYMFYGCRSLTTVPLLDFSSVTSAASMFYDCSRLTTVPQLDFSSVTDATNMFNGCTGLTTIPLLDFSKVTSAVSMFNSCRSLTTVPQLDFSSVTDATNMFNGCTGLTTVPQLNFSKVTNANDMFNGCTGLTTVPQLDFSSVTDATNMFCGCTGLTTVPQLDFSSVTNAVSMFNSCTRLTTVPQLDFSSVTDATNMFNGCTGLTTLDFSNIKTIGSNFARFSFSLSTLIIRNPTTLATLGNTDAFSNTPIAKGTGYIYVPDDLVNSYKQATNWSTFANQIKPLSELPQGD